MDGVRECFTLENGALAIPAGRYRIILIPSARAAAGALWAPHTDHVLPLLMDVPGRDGIRVHAANRATELTGCIAPGVTRGGSTVSGSRIALDGLMAKIQAARDGGESAWITVEDAFVE